tara:strand:+ start:2913 stop:3107 length:195 start_codon:yes stop_codon:yes gene_type:complete
MSSIRNIALSLKNLVKRKQLNEKIVENTLPVINENNRPIKDYNNFYSKEFLNFTLFDSKQLNKK